MIEKITIVDAYRILALRIVLFETFLMTHAPLQILDRSLDAIDKALVIIESYGGLDPEVLKKMLEYKLIHEYSCETKKASCLTCNIWHSCGKVDVESGEPEPVYLIEADKKCAQYERQNFVGSEQAKRLHPLLEVLGKKYGIGRERILSNI